MEYTFGNVFLVALVLFIVYTVGHYRGWKDAEKNARKKVAKFLASLPPEPVRMVVKVVKDKEVFHLYKEEDDSFIVTVKDMAEAKQELERLFPNTNVFVKADNAKEEGFV